MKHLAISMGLQVLAAIIYFIGLIFGGFTNVILMIVIFMIAFLLWLISFSFAVKFIWRVLWGELKNE